MDKTRQSGDLQSLIFFKYRVIGSRIMRWTGYVARLGKCTGAYRVLVEKSEAKRPLGRPSHKWNYNIKMDRQVVGSRHELD